jgi:transcriptional regulator with GAF, ATPase, and Fis domain
VPVLLALFGPKRGVRLEIGEAGAVLGRSSEADVQLVDSKVSRQHCRFAMEPGADPSALRVEDLGSHNGTYVNGERIEGPRLLAPGDEIAVGDSLFVLDGGGDVVPALFGDATLVVAPGAPVVEPPARQPETSGSAAAGVSTVSALAAELARCADLESAARAVLAAMERALNPRRAFVLAWDGARGLARPLVGRSEGAAVSVSRTVLELAARRRRAVVLEDAVEDRELGQARSVARHQLRAVLVAPILDGAAGSAGVIGFLHADRPGPPYRPEDGELLDCFAALFALHQGRPRRAETATGARPADGPDPIAGTSPALLAAVRTAAAAAATPSTVLITGESGTGKEEIARFIHARSARAGGPFVAVNCGAVPEGIAESELFGHERGAFTGASSARPGKIEAADGGTLFLDEVGELPPAIQVKLLRVLQERAFYRVGSTVLRRVDLRVVAATHRDLDAAVRERRFRDDLFYRLAVIRLHLPPLRDRAEDIAPLAHALLARVAAAIGRADPGLTPGALAVLGRWPWPGNARELGNVLERALVLRAPPGATGPLTADEMAAALGAPAAAASEPTAAGAPASLSLADKVAALERAEIEAALRRARGVKSKAAQALGLSRPTLDKKIADLGIDLWREPDGA